MGGGHGLSTASRSGPTTHEYAQPSRVTAPTPWNQGSSGRGHPSWRLRTHPQHSGMYLCGRVCPASRPPSPGGRTGCKLHLWADEMARARASTPETTAGGAQFPNSSPSDLLRPGPQPWDPQTLKSHIPRTTRLLTTGFLGPARLLAPRFLGPPDSQLLDSRDPPRLLTPRSLGTPDS